MECHNMASIFLIKTISQVFFRDYKRERAEVGISCRELEKIAEGNGNDCLN